MYIFDNIYTYNNDYINNLIIYDLTEAETGLVRIFCKYFTSFVVIDCNKFLNTPGLALNNTFRKFMFSLCMFGGMPSTMRLRIIPKSICIIFEFCNSSLLLIYIVNINLSIARNWLINSVSGFFIIVSSEIVVYIHSIRNSKATNQNSFSAKILFPSRIF